MKEKILFAILEIAALIVAVPVGLLILASLCHFFGSSVLKGIL